MDCSVVTAPMDFFAVVAGDCNVELVPHSNHAVVSVPFGFTEPLSVAAETVMDDAPAVVAVGATALVPPPPPPPQPTSNTTTRRKENRFRRASFSGRFGAGCYAPNISKSFYESECYSTVRSTPVKRDGLQAAPFLTARSGRVLTPAFSCGFPQSVDLPAPGARKSGEAGRRSGRGLRAAIPDLSTGRQQPAG